jgi:hypothetical protein
MRKLGGELEPGVTPIRNVTLMPTSERYVEQASPVRDTWKIAGRPLEREYGMESSLDWLNDQVDRMQAGKRPHAPQYTTDTEDRAEAVAMLQMAAQLNAVRPGTCQPDTNFVNSLRARLLDIARGPAGASLTGDDTN